jgi:hypothetical protein
VAIGSLKICFPVVARFSRHNDACEVSRTMRWLKHTATGGDWFLKDLLPDFAELFAHSIDRCGRFCHRSSRSIG